MNKKKLFKKALSSPKNLRFTEMQLLAESFGFEFSRISGSHHIYKHGHIAELLNLQEVNGQAKPYQVKQFIKLVEKYNLKLKE